jgi:hypothetical protein
LNESNFLGYRPSQIAAASLLIAINIFQLDPETNTDEKFFASAKRGELRNLNVALWNNQEITSVTGYSITDLTMCIFDLASFMKESLVPDRLVGFDI